MRNLISISWFLIRSFILPESPCWAFHNLLYYSHQMQSSQSVRWGPPKTLQASLSEHLTVPLKATSDATGADAIKTADVLSLDSIRSTLIRQEETIIFALIERAQFRHNPIVYQPGGFGDLGFPVGSSVSNSNNASIDDKHYSHLPLSFLDYMLIGTEILHCRVRRYTSPEEHPFFPDCLPQGTLLPQLDFPQLLSPIHGASSINFNPILLKKYIGWIVPLITTGGDDEQHGSTVLADIAVLQALSRRVHYGKFVAESKYQSDPIGYQKLVDAGDSRGVMERLTNAKVEEKVLKRARLKAATYGREPVVEEDLGPVHANVGNTKEQEKVDPLVIETIYRDFIIPLTKDIEVAYLFRRCGHVPPDEYSPHRMSTDLSI